MSRWTLFAGNISTGHSLLFLKTQAVEECKATTVVTLRMLDNVPWVICGRNSTDVSGALSFMGVSNRELVGFNRTSPVRCCNGNKEAGVTEN